MPNDRQFMEDAASLLRGMRGSLPYGISVKIDENTDNIIVSNDDLGFCITVEAVRNGLHLASYEPSLDKLIECCGNPATIEFCRNVNTVMNARDELEREAQGTRFDA